MTTAIATAPDIALARQFFEGIYSPVDGTPGKVCVYRANANGKPERTAFLDPHDFDGMARFIQDQAPLGNCYFLPDLIESDAVPEIRKRHGRGYESELSAVVAFRADVDGPKDGSKHNYPPRERILAATDAMPLKPSAIIGSGSEGVHPYWFLHEPEPIDSAETLGHLKAVSKAWHGLLRRKVGSDPDGKPYEVDSTADLARVLRPAGSIHHGRGSVVTPILWEPNRRFSLDDFEQFIIEDFEAARGADIEPIELPDDLERGDIIDQARSRLRRLAPAISGDGGHNRTFHAVCVLVLGYGLSVDEAYPLLEQWNSRCDPPWTDAELRHKLEDADKKPGVRGYLIATNRTELLPLIDASEQDLPAVTSQAWKALRKRNAPPRLFRYGARPVRTERGDGGELVLRDLTLDRMRFELANSAFWFKWHTPKGTGETIMVPQSPSDRVTKNVLATPDPQLPILIRIVEAPVFAPDGQIIFEHGYHPASKTYLAPSGELHVPPIADNPSARDVTCAVELIWNDLLGDFPFVDDKEKANAVALFLLPAARLLINGPTPLHLIEKPTPGTGATLLMDVLALLFSGHPLEAMTEGRDEDEWRKRITAKLRSGATFLPIDNLRRRLDSGVISAAITCRTWEDRLLGVSEVAKIPMQAVWLASGNNPTLSSEIARRTVRIRLDARSDRPWLRTGFRHPELRSWVIEHRGRVIWAALTLIRAWVAASRPEGKATLGMFESWATTIGGILDTAGVSGFLSNLEESYEASDSEGTAWREFIGAWWDMFQERPVAVNDLWPIVSVGNGDFDLLLGDGSERSQRTRLGKLIGRARDRTFTLSSPNGAETILRLKTAGTLRRAQLWNLES